MSGLAFAATLAALPLFGWGLVPGRTRSWLRGPASVAVAAGLGALALSVEMLAMSFAGIRWTAVRVGALPLALTVVRLAGQVARRAGTPGENDPPPWRLPPPLPLIGMAAALGVAAYASLSTRATSADLLFFWGAKAERFAAAGGIDVAFLRDPFHWGLHTDYPPLLPSLWAFASLVAGRFAWGASLVTLPVSAALLVLAVAGLAGRERDAEGAAWGAALAAAMLAATWPVSGTAGNADPLLIFLEGTALLLVVRAADEPGGPLLAGALLAAATLTKLEGTFFAAALSASSLLGERRGRLRRAAAIAVPPAAALLAWIAFCRTRGLVTYLGEPPRLYVDSARAAAVLRGLAASASYECAYLPWIVAVAALAASRPQSRRVLVPLAAAALILAADCAIYFVSPTDPTLWVAWSGSRLLLTPLFCLYAAAAAALADGGSAIRADPSRSSRDRTRTGARALPSA